MVKYNYVYKISNKINCKIYVGVHRHNKLKNSYMGSGTAIKYAIKKHGKENFTKEIIKVFNDYDDALLLEKELVTTEFIERNDNYNLKEGGFGGLYSIETKHLMSSTKKGKKLSEQHKKHIKDAFLLNGYPMQGKVHSICTKNKMSNAKKGKMTGERNPFFGKTHTEETREIIRKSKIGRNVSKETRRRMSKSCIGSKHWNYNNSKWIYNFKSPNGIVYTEVNNLKEFVSCIMGRGNLTFHTDSFNTRDGWYCSRKIKKG